MIDIKFLRENPDAVKQNIKNKFQDQKLPLVDEVIALDKESRACKMHGDELRSKRKSLSDKIGSLMKEGKKDEAEAIKTEVKAINDELVVNEEKEEKAIKEAKKETLKDVIIRMLKIQLTYDTIEQLTGASIEEIKEVRDELICQKI